MTDRIGLDTNVALRWLFHVQGDERQSEQASAAASAAEEIHLNLLVLAELVWLSGRAMKLDRDAQAALVDSLLENPRIDLAERECVEHALTAFRAGGAGYTDHLIAALNQKADCKTTLTFDRTVAKSQGFTLLP